MSATYIDTLEYWRDRALQAEKLPPVLRECAPTIAKHGRTISVTCDSDEEAQAVFEWLGDRHFATVTLIRSKKDRRY